MSGCFCFIFTVVLLLLLLLLLLLVFLLIFLITIIILLLLLLLLSAKVWCPDTFEPLATSGIYFHLGYTPPPPQTHVHNSSIHKPSQGDVGP